MVEIWKKILVVLISVIIIIIIFILVWFYKTQYQTKVTNQYDGRNLNIGIIGDIPKVREKQIKFIEIQFSDLGKERVNLDAIFIVEKICLKIHWRNILLFPKI